jgi:hypothetical protein
MTKIASLLQDRFKPTSSSNKMARLVQRSSEGSLQAFSLEAISLSEEDTGQLQKLLAPYVSFQEITDSDFHTLCSLTGEIKAITKQAILLHGEKIQKAQFLLKNYHQGVFSAWLKHTYGNRQTPYNLLLYYEFFHQLPAPIRPKLELLPKQAAYTLASRKGQLKNKIDIIESYRGQAKEHFLEIIRDQFPLPARDARQAHHPALNSIKQLLKVLKSTTRLNLNEKLQAESLLNECLKTIH